MTPRSGLYVALSGLVMAGLCLTTLHYFRDWNDPEMHGVGDLTILVMGVGFILLLDVGALLGLILMVVGLVWAWKKQSVKLSERG